MYSVTGPGQAAHLCLVWNIVCCPILCLCSKPVSSMLHGQFLICMQRLSVRTCPSGSLTRPLPRAVIILVDDLVSPLIKAMGVNGAQWTSVCSSTDLWGHSPQCFHRCWYVSTVVSLSHWIKPSIILGLTEIRKEFSTFFCFEIPIHKITKLGNFFSWLDSHLILGRHLAIPSSLPLHCGPWTLSLLLLPCASRTPSRPFVLENHGTFKKAG